MRKRRPKAIKSASRIGEISMKLVGSFVRWLIKAVFRFM